jgi:hypothetical protein
MGRFDAGDRHDGSFLVGYLDRALPALSKLTGDNV